MAQRKRTKRSTRNTSESESFEERDDFLQDDDEFLNQQSEEDDGAGGEAPLSDDEKTDIAEPGSDSVEDDMIDGFVISSATAPKARGEQREPSKRPIRVKKPTYLDDYEDEKVPTLPKATRKRTKAVREEVITTESDDKPLRDSEEKLSRKSLDAALLEQISKLRSQPGSSTKLAPPPLQGTVPGSAPFARCSWHIYIAYQIFWHQKQDVIRGMGGSVHLDPTYEAKILKQNNEAQKRKVPSVVPKFTSAIPPPPQPSRGPTMMSLQPQQRMSAQQQQQPMMAQQPYAMMMPQGQGQQVMYYVPQQQGGPQPFMQGGQYVQAFPGYVQQPQQVQSPQYRPVAVPYQQQQQQQPQYTRVPQYAGQQYPAPTVYKK